MFCLTSILHFLFLELNLLCFILYVPFKSIREVSNLFFILGHRSFSFEFIIFWSFLYQFLLYWNPQRHRVRPTGPCVPPLRCTNSGWTSCNWFFFFSSYCIENISFRNSIRVAYVYFSFLLISRFFPRSSILSLSVICP